MYNGVIRVEKFLDSFFINNTVNCSVFHNRAVDICNYSVEKNIDIFIMSKFCERKDVYE